MMRQRIRLRRSGFSELILRLLVTALALALAFYGVMVVLAAFKLAPDTINSISAYRTVNDTLGSITAGDITGTDRIIVAVAGLACLLVFGPPAWRALPRPYFTRTGVDLVTAQEHGTTEIEPRALERAGELATHDDPRVVESRARYHSGAVEVQVHLAGDVNDDGDGDGDETLLDTLRAVQTHIRSSLARQGFPIVAVDVTLAGAPASLISKENQS